MTIEQFLTNNWKMLPELPYKPKDLEPYITRHTFSYHYEKHHKAYIDNLVNLTKDNAYANEPLEAIVNASHGKTGEESIFNNAAQVWNHTFYWFCLSAKKDKAPSGALLDQLNKDFDSIETFFDEFQKAAVSQFGSGWAWLVLKDGKLTISKTSNAHTPVAHGEKALLTIDVWEHAYYLDYQNRRADYVKALLHHLIDWDFVGSRLEAALK